MLNLRGFDERERELLMTSWYPDFPQGELSPHKMQFLMDAKFEASAPLASYVLNRLSTWLEGADAFRGDAAFDVIRTEDPKARHCTLTRKADGASWRVTWSNRYGKPDRPEISLSAAAATGGWRTLADGEIATGLPGSGNRHDFSNAPPPVKGTVEADLHYGSFTDICAFCDAIKGSIPAELISNRDGAVTFAHQSRLEALEPLLVEDGGLPGRLCRGRNDFVDIIAAATGSEWIEGRYRALADGLRQAGAVWGEGVIEYNDLDYRCCVVDMPTGVALFNDNAATAADERSYLAHFIGGDRTDAVKVYVFGEEEDYRIKLEAIRAGEAVADFEFDFAKRAPTFSSSRLGHGGMTMFFWQFMSDSLYALEHGKLDTDCWYWQDPEPDTAPTPGAAV